MPRQQLTTKEKGRWWSDQQFGQYPQVNVPDLF
jgi:hypothetical protein